MPKKPTNIVEPINASFDDLTSVIVKSNLAVEQESNKFLIPNMLQEIEYSNNSGKEYYFYFDDKIQTIWGTKDQISKTFQCSLSNISEHISNIYKDCELSKDETFREFRNVSNQPVKYYNLDMIIALGYRVNSKKATEFRKWSTNILKQYIQDGYVIDEQRLREDPKTLNKLAAQIRELRAEEKNVYHSVRECFKLSASDYDPSSQEVRAFYTTLQDKFHHAITGMTSSKLIMDRADHTAENMGLQSLKGDVATLTEAKIGKNYLASNEIYRMYLLSEQFLLYAESTALMDKKMTMTLLHKQLDNLLKLNGYPVSDGYKDYLKDKAVSHAKMEFKSYEKIEKLKLSGIKIDLESFYSGEYDEQYDDLELAHNAFHY